MKKTLMLAMALVLLAGSAMAAVLASDTFSYADGSLVPNGGWVTHSGTAGDLLISNGQAVVQHGTPSEDAHLVFPTSTGTVFFSIDFSVDDLGAPWAGSDSEYFCHFMVDGSYSFVTRVDIVPPTGSGDFTIGLATYGGAAEETWATDLTYGVTYNLVASYNPVTNQSQLWIDPVGANSPYITGLAGTGSSLVIDSFGLRQSDSSLNETVRVDNLIVADACEDVFATCPSVANEDLSWGAVKALY